MFTDADQSLIDAWLRTARAFDTRSDVEQLVELQRLVRERIRYEDQGDNDRDWALPHVTLSRGRGNCNDYAGLAFFTAHMLNLGDDPDHSGDGVRMVHTKLADGRGHMICGVLVDGELWGLDNRFRQPYLIETTSGDQTVLAEYSIAQFRMRGEPMPVISERFDTMVSSMSEYRGAAFLMPDMAGA